MSRNDLRITGGVLTVTPRGLDRLWCFRKNVVVALVNISGVRIERHASRVPTGWRGPGLDFMGKLCGTFHPPGERHFWNYLGSGEVLRITIAGDQHFQQLNLSVDDAKSSRNVLLDAISPQSAQ
ncbi:hypothetical protein [Salinibacterium sp. PAMC 21357]|uniref:hypothetical protein n=1 Tax=Salinibacterium sp. PAMC 21357 TaxID=1112215 RepID=UPI0002887F33|nr:hypothetical protein [Salinibacterium sp. PAMC 21357]